MAATHTGAGAAAAPEPYAPEALHRLDVTDAGAVDAVLAATRPEAVVLLAGISDPPEVGRRPIAGAAINVLGTVHALEAVARHAPSARVVLFSTGCVYEGAGPERCPWDETVPPAPRSLYAATKLSAETFARAYALQRGLSVAIVRPFNQIGPGQRPEFAISRFARSAVRIALGLDPPRLEVGNLEARRDFCDVRDLARALPRVLERARPGVPVVYNLSSGRAVRVGDLLDVVLSRAGVEVELVPSERLHRPLDVPVSAGDAGLAWRELGWRPELPLDTSIDDCLADWRRRLAPGLDAPR